MKSADINPHSQTLTTRKGIPVFLQAVLPDGKYLFRVCTAAGLKAQYLVTDKAGRSAEKGSLVVKDASIPAEPKAAPNPRFTVGQEVFWTPWGRSHPKVMRGVVAQKKKYHYTIRLSDGQTVNAITFQIFSSAEDLRRHIEELSDLLAVAEGGLRAAAVPSRRIVPAPGLQGGLR